jgi:ABC-type multidrug transport system ATPase subunit
VPKLNIAFDYSDPFDMSRLRRMTGVCMQQDLLFQALTVQEHLEFYGRLRVSEFKSLFAFLPQV